ncbi:hypothetical protein K458DRAFT_194111 [Lentithecium fluviatile CBS 122367]|uniref:Uncharacterized protein n=1 Tax=Lentithecium fluviatile CBS 122367 TaxID=1168545 RepID=A0A6G1IDH0_9PLEO|nr:hypothetical protein K458DRAFT_194111 [Lentithecium fluviatile CBS 122367]
MRASAGHGARRRRRRRHPESACYSGQHLNDAVMGRSVTTMVRSCPKKHISRMTSSTSSASEASPALAGGGQGSHDAASARSRHSSAVAAPRRSPAGLPSGQWAETWPQLPVASLVRPRATLSHLLSFKATKIQQTTTHPPEHQQPLRTRPQSPFQTTAPAPCRAPIPVARIPTIVRRAR